MIADRGNETEITFSIITPIYNAAAYLSPCLQSILTQTYQRFELIIIDDGSQDDSLAIVAAYANKHPQIRVIHKSHAGVSAARNAGLQAASGKYILFVDADDYFLDRQALAKLKQAAEKQTDLVIFNTFYEHQTIKKAGQHYYLDKHDLDDFLFKVIKNESLNSLFNKMYERRKILKYQIQFKDELEIAEDLLFNIDYMQHCQTVYFLSDYLYFYRRTNANSITKQYLSHKYQHLMYVNDRMQQWLANKRQPKLLNLAKYLRIKYIFSCIRDITHPAAPAHIKNHYTHLQQYKRDNPRIIVRGCELKLYLMSVLYSFINIVFLGWIINKIYTGFNPR